jgi:hypothetical protein
MMASDEDLLDVETKRLRAIMFGMLIISAVCALGLLIDLFVELVQLCMQPNITAMRDALRRRCGNLLLGAFDFRAALLCN